jgi:ubiquinone/menaquinone biosynthesis C-methylase UbiE
MSQSVVDEVAKHYAPADLKSRVAAVLDAAGKDSSNTTVDDLASLDQSHVMGALATRRLAETAGITSEDHVLDVGCGMGGPARLIASTYGCKVTGVDVTPPYLETAAYLTELTGLTDQVTLMEADATALPFDDSSFSVGWTQHAAQNIEDKARFFGEFHRVLRPGSKLVVHDLYRGPTGEVHFPAIWGREESISFLISDNAMQEIMESNGFRIADWTDTTQEAWDSNAKRAQGDLHAREGRVAIEGLNITLLHPEDAMTLAMNSVKDFEVGSVGIFEAILEKA